MDPLSNPTFTTQKKELLCQAVQQEDWPGFCAIIDTITVPGNRVAAVRAVAAYGQAKHLDYVLEGVNIASHGDGLLKHAARAGHPELFDNILPRLPRPPSKHEWLECIRLAVLGHPMGAPSPMLEKLLADAGALGVIDDLDLPLAAAAERDLVDVMHRLLGEGTELGATQALYHACRYHKPWFCSALVARVDCDPVRSAVLLVHNGFSPAADRLSAYLTDAQCSQVLQALRTDAELYGLDMDLPRLKTRGEQLQLNQDTAPSTSQTPRPRF